MAGWPDPAPLSRRTGDRHERPHRPLHLLPEVQLRDVPAALIDALKARFGEQCSTALAVREQHGRDEVAQAPPPAAVVFAESTGRGRCRAWPASTCR
jgi:hypothetical protein